MISSNIFVLQKISLLFQVIILDHMSNFNLTYKTAKQNRHYMQKQIPKT